VQSLHHGNGVDSPDLLATICEIFYFLHFPLPLAIGFLLWIRQRRVYYDFVAALIVLSMAAFVTYLLLPVAPPWWARAHGAVTGVSRFSQTGFDGLARASSASTLTSTSSRTQNVYGISSNDVAAFPSLHAAYPFLAFLFARQGIRQGRLADARLYGLHLVRNRLPRRALGGRHHRRRHVCLRRVLRRHARACLGSTVHGSHRR
jgi:hypothetical protein